MLLVPKNATPAIAAFAKQLCNGEAPQFIDIIPDSEATPLSCWQNVHSVCARKGGQAVKGWRLWWIPDVMVEAQAHVIWERPDGILIDVTPNEDQEHVCLFLRDPEMRQRPGVDCVPSRQQNICGKAFVDEFIACSAKMARYMDMAKTGEIDTRNPQLLVEIARLDQTLQRCRQQIADLAASSGREGSQT